jgi:hypothetical protein
MRVLHMVGSDPDRFECPHCGAHDRERHLLMYMRAAGTLEWLRGKAVLHLAPERKLSRFILDAAPCRYVRADLFPASRDIERVDMLAMQFGDELSIASSPTTCWNTSTMTPGRWRRSAACSNRAA